MMSARRLAVGLVVLAAATLSYAAGQSEQATTSSSVIEYEVAARISKDRVPASRPTYFEDQMVEKFGIKFNYQDIPEPEYVQKVLLLVASGEQIDFFQLGGVVVGKQLGDEGYLKAVDAYVSKLPGYRKLFTDEQWAEAYEKRALADGKTYVLPAPFTGTGDYVYAGWIYKKSAWDKLGLALPKTVEELARQLELIKKQYPDAVGLATRSKTLAYDLAFCFRTDQDWYVDYDLTPAGDKISFGPTTQKYRDMLVFARGLYAKGLVDPEFPTITEQKWSEKFARGVAYTDFDYPTRAPWAEGLEKAINPTVDWEALPYFLGSEKYPAGPITTATVDYSRYSETDGMIPVHLTGEKEARLLRYLDWTVTEEGKLFTMYGVEGVTFSRQADGTPRLFSYQYTDSSGAVVQGRTPIKDPKTGQQVQWGWQIGFPPASPDFSGPLLAHPLNQKPSREAAPLNSLLLSGGVSLFRDDFWNVLWKFTPEEEKRKNDLDTVIKDTRDSHILQFILGQMDPANDAHWSQFQNALKDAHLADELALRDQVMARIKANLKRPSYATK